MDIQNSTRHAAISGLMQTVQSAAACNSNSSFKAAWRNAQYN